MRDDNDLLVAGELPADPADGGTPMPPPASKRALAGSLKVVKGGGGAAAKPSTVAPRAPSDLVSIAVDVDLDRMREEAAGALVRHPDIYQRGDHLAHVVYAPKAESLFAPGAPTVRRLPLSVLKTKITRVADFVEINEANGNETSVEPPDSIVRAVHEQGDWPGVRALIGILEAPAIRPDGSILQTPGYDARSGYLYEPRITFDQVPEAPTQEDARRAFTELEEVFLDFPFVDDAARSVAVAALLTVMARPAIRGSVPAMLIDASTRGSGKTLVTDAVAMIATGRMTAKMGWPPSDEELEKVISAYALRGASIINFDNIIRPFGGAPLDRVLTSVDSVELRVLGKSEVPVMPWRAVVCGTGNNVQLAGDTARRCLVARIESKLENPEDRPESDFRHWPLLPWVEEHRARLVRAALVVLRAWHVAGRPLGGCRTWGSFEAWAGVVPPAIVFAGGADPMGCRAEAAGVEDVGKMALSVILDQLPRLDPLSKGITVRSVIHALYAKRREQGGEPDGFDDLREAIEAMVTTREGQSPDARKVGDAFRSFRRRNLRGKSLVTDDTDRNGVAKWKVVAC